MENEIHSRSYLLVQKEISLLQRETDLLRIVNVNLPTKLLCLLYPSPADQTWKGGSFYISVHFPQNYNFSPPIFQFLTIPFHPNVHPTKGNCLVPRLNKWNEFSRVADILQEIQEILMYPDITNDDYVLNSDAKDVLLSSPDLYGAMASQCVHNSHNLEDFLKTADYSGSFDLRYSKDRVKAFVKPGGAVLHSAVSKTPNKECVRQVAFEDYQNFWGSIGTTKSSVKYKDFESAKYLSLNLKKSAHITPPTNSVEPFRKSGFCHHIPHGQKAKGLKTKLESVLSPENSFEVGVEPVTLKGRPISSSTVPVEADQRSTRHSLTLNTNTPITSQSPRPFAHIGKLPREAIDEIPPIGVTVIQKDFAVTTTSNRDFSGQMPSLPPSKEQKYRFRSDEPIFDDSKASAEGELLLDWTKSLNESHV